MGQKLRGLWRVMAVVSVPILIHAVLVGYFHISAHPRDSYYGQQGFSASQSAELHFIVEALYLIVLLSLAAQLAFLFSLTAKTQGRAVTVTLAVFTAWSVIPLLIRDKGGYGDIWGEAWVMYLSPISGIALNGLFQYRLVVEPASRDGDGPFRLLPLDPSRNLRGDRRVPGLVQLPPGRPCSVPAGEKHRGLDCFPCRGPVLASVSRVNCLRGTGPADSRTSAIRR